MKFAEVFRFEIGYHLRQLSTWLYLALLLALTLLMTLGADPLISSRNAPVNLATWSLALGLVATLVTAALFVDAGHRDIRWRLEPLLHTTPLHKLDFVAGRFTGTLLVNAVLLLAVPAGLLLSALHPGFRAGMLSPFHPEAYLLPYLFLLLPNVLVSAAVLFGVTVLSRRSLPAYLAALALLGANLVSLNLSVGVEGSPLLALLDPSGGVAMTRLTRDWTPAEQTARLLDFGGVLLWNRLLWMTAAGAMLTFTYRRFRLAHAAAAGGARRQAVPEAVDEGQLEVSVQSRQAALTAVRASGARARAQQVLAIAGLGLRHIVLSREFLLLTAGLFVFAVLVVWDGMTDPMFGVRKWPLTQEVTVRIAGRAFRLLMALLTVFYAGELMWHHREAGIHELRDTRPVPDWVPFAGNFLTLSLLLVLLQGALTGAGMLVQVVQGYSRLQPALYLQIMFGLRLADYLLFAVLALLVHVLVNHKYAGHVAAVVLFLALGRAAQFGIEHNLLVYGSDAGWVYSDLNGFGPFLKPLVWFKVYSAGWALLLGVVALLFLVRGVETHPRARLRQARQRLTRPVVSAAAVASLLVLLTGGFIFYNTSILNEYRTGTDADGVLAEHEWRYKRFEHAPQPWLTGMGLHIELDPDRRELTVRGTYRLVNRTDQPIDSVHLSSYPSPGVTLRDVRFDRAAEPVLEDARHGYRIYSLGPALQPGDSLLLHFTVTVAQRAFRNRESASPNAILLGRFTHASSPLLLPAIGYQRDLMELSSPRTRLEHGLPALDVQPSVHDVAARRVPRGAGNADWIDFEATVGTAGNHFAVLPGTLQRAWVEGGRRYFRYRAETPIPTFFALISADHAVRSATWSGAGSHAPVDIRVLHHPDHAFNVDLTLRNIATALDNFTLDFGPYPYRQMWLVEFPRYGNFGRAYPGYVVFTESSAIAVGRRDEQSKETDAALLLTAHEIAHHWWGKQLIAADVQGSQVLTETLAQYSAALVLERTHGPAAAHQFLRGMHLSYTGSRGSHMRPEVPLLLSTDHEYIHYRKGPVVLYSLRHYLGEERVNRALRRLVEEHRYQGAPYPTSLDLHRQLQAVTPDSLQYLLHDLLASITLWDLGATGARADSAGAGEYRVTLEVDATKLRADSVGNDTPVPMNDLVEIGVFARPQDGQRLGEPLYLGMHRIRSGAQTVTVTVRGVPHTAAVDPWNRLIARHREGLVDRGLTEVRLPASRTP